MATPSPAPSRVAVNALRGVLLTTSCSVIILAEERRRRLNIARAALDNAKKLHTARVNRNSAALAESYSSRRESFPVEIAHDFSHAPTNNAVRRRRTRIDSLEHELSRLKEIEHVESFETTLPEDRDSTSTPQNRQRRWDDWDAARKELSRISENSAFSHNALSIRLSPEIRLPTTSSPRTRPANSKTNKARKGASTGSTKISMMDNTSTSGDGQVGAIKLELADEASIGQQESWSRLDNLLTEMETQDLPRDERVQNETRAIEMLKSLTLTSTQSEEAQEVLSRGIRILQSTALSREYGIIPLILEAVRPVCNDICLLAVPFLDSLSRSRDVEGVKHLLRSLSRFEPQSKQAVNTNRSEWATRLLMHYWRKTKDFLEVKTIYTLLQKGGLFDDSVFSSSTQYAVRRRITLIALDAGDDATASAEMSQLREMRPKASGVDVKLRGRFIVREAELGQWDKVLAGLEAFGPKAKQSDQFQNVLSWLTKIYCKDHTTTEMDIFVRNLVSNHHMSLNKPLAFFVMDRHGRTRNLQALVAWVQFCQDGGLAMDQIFFNEIADKCCRYWNLSRADVIRMLKDARTSAPWLKDPLLTSYASAGGLHDLHKPLPGERTDCYGIAPTLPERRGDSISIYERAAFKHMNTLALENDWTGVYSAYKEATKKGLGDSSRCLRLAVVANIHLEGPHSGTVTCLINEAYIRNHDISGALVPMLVARLEAGDNVNDLLRENLAKGQHIHDSVYNKAARVLTQKGNPEAAIKVCEMAAQQNGMGELAYNKFNFASLIHSYTGQGRYRDLMSLIASFISKSEWWQGSKECKESVKLAMKHVASRAATDHRREDTHKQVLLRLDDALEHIKSLRATNKQEREAVTKEVVGAFKAVEEPVAFEGGFFPETQSGRQTPKDKRNTDWELSSRRDSTPQVLGESRHRIVEDELPTRQHKIEKIRTSRHERTKRERTPSPELTEDDIYLEKEIARVMA
ncbi:uncharacterized protein FSUBG_11661 [Fusarium subglutinans]|uniref:Pentatricopeptide repeat protein n=1 Tax=Gibberella subglutinans TaxID=42677 RepID=A0A8H5LBW5_GIBSU|nr:uncharacterized protein FSUBG_11661 [Fusarium subglutinans]KAF5587861.1 hypothetical protein FSUBG_11661 [Fusarium subglutinans]